MAPQAELIAARLYHSVAGLVNAMPDYMIDKRALAEEINFHTDRSRVRTAPGRAKVNATAMHGATVIRGQLFRERTDGTQDHVIATSGAYWTISGDTKTLISKSNPGGSIVNVSASIISGTSACQFLGNVAINDLFFIDSDTVSAALTITAISSNNVLRYGGAYAGTASAGAYTIWDLQADRRVRMKVFMNRVFFVNGSDRAMEWNGTTFREVGLSAAPVPNGISALSADGGGLTSFNTYSIKVCWQDARGKYGQPSTAITASVSATHNAIHLSGFGDYPSYAVSARVYTTSADGDTYYLHGTGPINATYAILSVSGVDATEEPPTENYQPPISAEDVEFHRDRAIWMRGSRIFIGGLDPLDDHAGSPPGRWQPEYAPNRQQYLGRDMGQANDGRGLFRHKGRLYALQSDSWWRLWDESDLPNVWHWDYISNIGCESMWTLDTDAEAWYWLARRKGRLTVMRFEGGWPDAIGDNIKGSLDSITSTSACAGGCGNGYYRMSLAYSAADRELEWNADQGAWCHRDWKHECYASSPVSAYGADDSGFVYQLDTGTSDAGAAITRQLDFPAAADQGPDWPVLWQFLALEIDTVNAVSAISAISGWYKVDGGAWTTLSGAGFPVSAAAGAVTIVRRRVPSKMQGRKVAVRIKSTGMLEDYEVVGLTLKGHPDRNRNGT